MFWLPSVENEFGTVVEKDEAVPSWDTVNDPFPSTRDDSIFVLPMHTEALSESDDIANAETPPAMSNIKNNAEIMWDVFMLYLFFTRLVLSFSS